MEARACFVEGACTYEERDYSLTEPGTYIVGNDLSMFLLIERDQVSRRLAVRVSARAPRWLRWLSWVANRSATGATHPWGVLLFWPLPSHIPFPGPLCRLAPPRQFGSREKGASSCKK
jgi:hypothetical protein